MQDEAEEVNVGMLDGLLDEEVMGHELDTTAEIRREQLLALGDGPLQILNDKFQVLRRAREGLTDPAMAAADIDDATSRPVHGAPVVPVDEMLDIVQATLRHEPHPSAKATRPLRIARQVLIKRILRPLRDVEPRLGRLA